METEPKEFLDRNADLDARVAEIRDTDFAVLHAPEDPQLYWAFLLWELERTGREPRRHLHQFGLSDAEYAYVHSKHSVDVVMSRDANARGSAYLHHNVIKPESWDRICRALLTDPRTRGIHIVESNFTIAERVVESLLESEDPKEFIERSSTVDLNELRADLFKNLPGLGLVRFHLLKGIHATEMHVLTAKEPVSDNGLDRRNDLDIAEQQTITNTTVKFLQDRGLEVREVSYRACSATYKNVSKASRIVFYFNVEDSMQVVNHDNDK
jgi:hypothetical protein